MWTRRSALLVGGALLLLVGAAACGGGTRCFREGVPPPERARPSGTLLVGLDESHRSPAECPPDRPAPGSACTLATTPATDSAGNTVELWPTCYYEHRDRPCDPDGCTCQRASPDAPATFVCDRVVVE